MHSRIAWKSTIAIGVVALIILHPYVFGLSGRLSELMFQSKLHKGMPRAEAVDLARRFGGTDLGGARIAPSWVDSRTHGAAGSTDVQFVDFATLCVVNGKWYTLNFASDWEAAIVVSPAVGKRLLTC